MISLASARRSDRRMTAATSLTVPEFDALARQLAPLWAGTLAGQTAQGARASAAPAAGAKGGTPSRT